MTPYWRTMVCIAIAAICGSGCRSSPSVVSSSADPPTSLTAADDPTSVDELSGVAILGESDSRSIRLTSVEGDDAESLDASQQLPETLSLAWLVEQVQQVNPSVQAMYAAWQAASERYPQVISLDDPMFTATVAPGSFDSQDVESAYAFEASQKLPWYGKRRLRGEAALWEAGSASFDVTTTRQKLAEAAELAYWDYFAAQRQLELNEQNQKIMRSFRDSADDRYRTGLVSQQDVLQADIELANLEQRRIELQRMNRISAGRINVLIRRSPITPLPPASKTLPNRTLDNDVDTIISAAIAQRPEISAASARIQALEAKWGLACKEYYPDVEVFGRYDKFWQPTDTQSELQSQVGVRLNVPIYRGRRDAAVNEAAHEFSKARAEYDQLVLDVQAEVQAAFEQQQESNRIVALYVDSLIPAAEQNVAVARSNYDVSKITFLDLAIAQRQLVEARDRQIQAQIESQRRAATLRRVSGAAAER